MIFKRQERKNDLLETVHATCKEAIGGETVGIIKD